MRCFIVPYRIDIVLVQVEHVRGSVDTMFHVTYLFSIYICPRFLLSLYLKHHDIGHSFNFGIGNFNFGIGNKEHSDDTRSRVLDIDEFDHLL